MYSSEETVPKVTYRRNLRPGLRESDPAVEIGDQQEDTVPKVTYRRNLALGLRESDPAIQNGDKQDETFSKEPHGRNLAFGFRESDPAIEIGDEEEGTSSKVTYRRNIALGIRISDPPVEIGDKQEETIPKVTYRRYTALGREYTKPANENGDEQEAETIPKVLYTPIQPGGIERAKELKEYTDITRNDPHQTHRKELWSPSADDVTPEIPKTKKILFKCIVLVTFILGIIVGTIAGASVYVMTKGSNNSTRGSIKDDIIPPEECKNVSVALGDEIIIECFINDDTWEDSRLPVRIEVVHENPILNVNGTCSDVGKTVTCTPGKARCSSRGRFNIRFFNSFDKDAKPEFTKTVNVNIRVGPPETDIQQEYTGNDNNFVFHLGCKYEKGCDIYQMQFYGGGHTLVDPLECSDSSYTDNEGYSIQCTANVPGNVIYEYGNGSQLYCQLTDGQRVRQERPFLLPSCDDYSISNNNCSQTTKELYECTSDTNGTLINGHTRCELIEACYSLRHIPSQDGTCKLKWCQNATDLHIDRNGDSLFQPLCNQL